MAGSSGSVIWRDTNFSQKLIRNTSQTISIFMVCVKKYSISRKPWPWSCEVTAPIQRTWMIHSFSKFINQPWTCTEWFMRATFYHPMVLTKCEKSFCRGLLERVHVFSVNANTYYQLESLKNFPHLASKFTALDASTCTCLVKNNWTLMVLTLEPVSLMYS